jgi:histidine triad (HIT) family protein
MACLFCRIVAHEVPAQLVLEEADLIAFKDINPQAPLHALVVPKQHLRSLAEADDPGLAGRLVLTAARLAEEAGYGDSGFRVVVNAGRDAGQSVDHLHVHVLAGRSLAWPPG